MQKTLIDFKNISSFPKLTRDYYSGIDELNSLYKYAPSIESFRQAIADRSALPINRKLLTEVLLKQNKNASKDAIRNIELLIDDKTFTVVTGHQLKIFTGPLYFIFKIITVINLAKELKKAYPENNFVPVYWMASEDHDIEEINNFNLFGKTMVWDTDQKGAAGKLDTKSIVIILDQLDELLGESDNAKYLRDLFNNAYEESQNLAEATRYLVNELFGKYGLVIVDADDAQLKYEFKDCMIDDLISHSNYTIVNKTISNIQDDYKIQVNPREINLFYMKDGMRERIVNPSEDKFEILNTDLSFTKAEILNELEIHPERFSPNVMLRPLYQQRILPNLAYIGGPSEIAYWLEYKAMFDYNKINYPIIMMRCSALWIDDNNLTKLSKLNIEPASLFSNTELMIKEYIQNNSNSNFDFTKEKDSITEMYNNISKNAALIDKTLVSSIEAELQKHLNSLSSIEEKLIRAQKKKMETTINQIRGIKSKLFPNDGLQERYDNFIPYYLKYGQEFFDILFENLQPFDGKLAIIS